MSSHSLQGPTPPGRSMFAGSVRQHAVGQLQLINALARLQHRQHTHGANLPAAEDVALVAARLAELLGAAARSPAGTRPRRTRREQRDAEQDTIRYRDERIYGPGGRAAYNKRMYGK